MSSSGSSPSRAALTVAFAVIYIVWGSTYLGIRLAVETLPPFLMAGTRFLLAGGLLVAWVAATRGFRATARQWRDNAVIGAFLLLGGNGLISWAEQSIPSGMTALLVGAQPLMMVLTEWIWPGGHRPTKILWAGLALGFAGVAWLAAPWQRPADGGLNLGGLTAILAGCACWAIGSIYGRRVRQPAETLSAAAMQMLGGGVALMAVTLVHGDFTRFSPSAVSAHSWLAFGYLIVMGSLVGFSTFVWLMKHSTPARVSTYAYVNPLVAVFLGWLILGEPVTGRTLTAAAVIVVSVAIITRQHGRGPATASARAPTTVRDREPGRLGFDPSAAPADNPVE